MYIVYGNAYDKPYGCEIVLYGIAETIEKAKELEIKAKEETCYVMIEEVDVNTYCDKYLGGYIE